MFRARLLLQLATRGTGPKGFSRDRAEEAELVPSRRQLVRMIVLPLLFGAGLKTGDIVLGQNFHVVEPGQVFRSAQLDGHALEERIEGCDRVIVVGTPLYRRKYENKDTGTGYVVAAEVDVISNRLLGTEQEKESVLPLLLEGDKKSALPPLLQGRVFADFRTERAYFTTTFDLILDLYGIAHTDTAVADLRESLRASGRP